MAVSSRTAVKQYYQIWVGSFRGLIVGQKSRNSWRKTCPNVTSSATNSTWAARRRNPDLRGDT